MIAEMLGKVTGTSKGKGGPMHLSDPRSGVMVTSGIVGGGLPIAVGLALASRLRKTDQVTVVNFGDGATSIGATHEAVNLAALWQLPVVFVCQHNGYGEHTQFSDYTRTERLADRFRTYGMRAITVDGNSVPELYEASGEAINAARAGRGPTFLECLTYRLEGHSFGADTSYMDAERLAQARKAEPIGRYREWLKDRGIAESALEGIEKEVAEESEIAFRDAKSADYPGIDELLVDVFSSKEAVPQ